MIETTSSRQSTEAVSSSSDEAGSAITCTICGAGYEPSELKQALPSAIESAFMSICHFCFRCRRPACPRCWDAVHGICGACVEEAQLPFRSAVRPLAGMLFPPVPGTQRTRTIQDNLGSPLFVCIRPGRFQLTEPEIDLISTADTVEMVPVETAGEKREKKQERQGGAEEQRGEGVSDVQEETKVLPAAEVRAPVAPKRTSAWVLIFSAIDRFLTMLALITLLTIAVVVPWAEYSSTVNAQVMHLVHIDIRREIAYLLQLVHNIH